MLPELTHGVECAFYQVAPYLCCRPGASKAGLAHLQARSQDGHSLSLVAAHSRPQAGSASSTANSSSSGTEQLARTPRFKFLGAQSPQAAATREQQVLSGHVLGAVGKGPALLAGVAVLCYVSLLSAVYPSWQHDCHAAKESKKQCMLYNGSIAAINPRSHGSWHALLVGIWRLWPCCV